MSNPIPPNPNPGSENQPDPTPKNQPNLGVIDPKNDPEFLKEAAREAHRSANLANTRAGQLEAELNALKAASKGDDSKLKDFVLPTKDEYWEDPVQANVNVTKRLLEEAIAPLREQLKPIAETAKGFARTDALSQAKMRFKNDLRFKVVFANPSVEGMLDQWLSQSPEVNDNVVLQYLYSIMGAIATGEIKVAGQEPPVSLPPSGPPARDLENAPKTRALTEGEKSLARRYNLSDSAFLSLYDTADEITLAQIDKGFTPQKKD